MTAIQDGCAKALTNLSDGIDAECRFPRNVFIGDWSDFFFFDSDWMFDPEFVERVKSFLDVENGVCACFSNLDAASDRKRQERQFFIDQQTSPAAFQSLLRGDTPGSGWIHNIDRFGCTSDVSQWCIYCERGNEIAVIAIRQGISVKHYMSQIAQFKAMRIDEAIRHPLAYGFSARALSAPWRSEFIREYAKRLP